MSYGRDRTVIPVTIASGASQSGEFQTNGMRIVGIQMPAAWTAAGITFLALVRAPTGAGSEVFGLVQDDAGVEIAITTPAADEYVAINGQKLVGLGRVKLRSGTAGVPVNQAAERALFVVLAD